MTQEELIQYIRALLLNGIGKEEIAAELGKRFSQENIYLATRAAELLITKGLTGSLKI